MTQRNSSCKLSALIARCCRRQAALFALSFMAMLASMPVYMMLCIRSYERMYGYTGTETTDDIRKALLQVVRDSLYCGQFASYALIVCAVLAGIAMFRYLHVGRQTDFFHSLPVRRGKLFAARIITGLLAVVPAYLIGFVLSYAVVGAYGYGEALHIGAAALSVVSRLCCFLLVYAVSVAAAVLCGNTLVAAAACGVLQLGPVMTGELVNSLLNILYPARIGNSLPFTTVCPPLHMFGTVSSMSYDLYQGAEISADTLRSVLAEDTGCLIAAAIVLALSLLLYRIRRSEHTGRAVAFPLIELPVKLWVVSLAALGCGIIFESMTSNWKIMFLGMALGGVVMACVMEVILDLDFHSLFNRWKSTLVYAALCAVVLGCMAFDVTGWNSTLPDRTEIVSADFSGMLMEWDCSAQGSVLGETDESDDDTSAAQFTQAEVIDAIYDSAQYGAERMTGDRSTIRDGYSYNVYFTLSNGKTFERTYYAPNSVSEQDMEDEDYARLTNNASTVRFSEEYLTQRSLAALAYASREDAARIVPVNYVNAEQKITSDQCVNSSQQIQKVLETLYRENHSLEADYVSQHAPVAVLRVMSARAKEIMDKKGSCSYYNDYIDYDDYSMSLSGDVYTYESDTFYIDVPVYACEEETLALLSEVADGFQSGFAGQTVLSITVTTYSSETGEAEETTEYTDADEIAAVLPTIYPIDIDYNTTMTDPLLKTTGQDVIVVLESGSSISCQQIGDPGSAEAAGVSTDYGVIGSADIATAIMVAG